MNLRLNQQPITVILALILSTTVGIAASLDSKPTFILVGFIFVVSWVMLQKGLDFAIVSMSLTGVLTIRPFIGGERFTKIGDILLFGALLLALSNKPNKRLSQLDKSSVSVFFWLMAAYAWMGVGIILHPWANAEQWIGDFINGPLIFAALLFILQKESRRFLFCRGLVGVCIFLSGSYALTFLAWKLLGNGALNVGVLPLSYSHWGVSLYLPFTLAGFVEHDSLSNIPRLFGIGREPGICAAVMGWCYFMLPRLGWSHWIWRTLILIGLLGSQSTASLVIFFPILAIFAALHPGVRFRHLGTFARLLVGAVAAIATFWVALHVPGLGLVDKEALAPSSISDRTTATQLGLSAALTHPFGHETITVLQEDGNPVKGGINLIASIASIGLPGAVLFGLALLAPIKTSRQKSIAWPSVAVIFLTVLFAQPALASIGFYILTAVALGPASWKESEVKTQSKFGDTYFNSNTSLSSEGR